jgi:hypothetical protein
VSGKALAGGVQGDPQPVASAIPLTSFSNDANDRKTFPEKGSGVVFGQAAFHGVDRCPKTTPDPVPPTLCVVRC